MKKPYWIALFAGVLAFGVAACGDDVQIVDPEPTPPPALSVTLTPQQLNLEVGESANLTVGITGGDPAAQAQVTCESSNTGVATAAQQGDDICAVTAVAAGTATVTARVTKGNQTSSAGAAVTVTAVPEPEPEPELEPATVSINRVLKGESTADLDNASGQLDVVINLRRNEETVEAVKLLVDNIEVARQTFSRAELDEIAAAIAEDAEIAEAVEQITLSFKSDFYEILDGAAVIRTPNGDYSLSAAAIVAEDDEARASDALPITFDNEDGFHVVSVRAEGTRTATSSTGRLWIGGPDFGISVNPIPVMFTGREITEMRVQLRQKRRDDAETAGFQRCEAVDPAAAGPFDFECAGIEADSVAPRLTSVVAPGDTGPSIGADASGILNLDERGTSHDFPARIDVRPPQAAAGAFGIVQDPALLNTGNWVNAAYRFAQGFDTNQVTDGGVGRPDAVADGVQFAVSTGTTTESAFWVGGFGSTAGDVTRDEEPLQETVTNTELHAWARVEDRLGNFAFIRQQANVDDFHPERTFGYDITPPTLVFAEGEDAFGQLDDRYVFVNEFGDADGYDIDGTDILAGFHPDFAAEHDIVTVRGAFQQNGGIERISLVGAAPVAMPFEAVRDDRAMSTLEPVDLAQFFETQTRVRFQLGPVGPRNVLEDNVTLRNRLAALQETPAGVPPARYYIYQVLVRDQAGNTTKDYRAIYLNNGSRPEIEGLRNPSTFDVNTAFTVTVARDSVELKQGALEIRYPNTLGTLVWERPVLEDIPADEQRTITSGLEMFAGVEDGTLWNDVIYRPQENISFPLGLSGLGLNAFINNVQVLQGVPEDETVSGFPAMIGQAKPDSVRARMFNGWGSRQPGLTISSALPSTGASNIVSTTIQPEEISSPSFYFQNRSATAPVVTDGLVAAPDWTFEIVAGAAQCPDDFCVHAIGPLSTFTNPFAGGPVAIVWAQSDNTNPVLAASGTQVATDNLTLQWRVATIADPTFNDPQPTRDSGENRLYEWSFNIDGAAPGTSLDNVKIAAIGIRPSGDALRTAPVRAGEPPVQEFNVVFDPTSAMVPASGAQTFLVQLGEGSPTEDFNVLSCAITETSNLTAGATATVAENSCLFDAGTADPGDTFTIRARVTSDSGAERLIFATATIGPFDFQVGFIPALIQLPVPTQEPQVLDFEVTSNTELSSFLCSLPTTPSGIGVVRVEVGGNVVCRVTVAPGVEPGDYTVQGRGERVGPFQEAETTAILRLLPTDISFEAEVVLDASDPETLVVFDGPLPPGNFADGGEFRFGPQSQRFDVDFEVEVRFATGPNAGEVAVGVPVGFSSLGIRVTLESDQVLTDENGRARIGVTAQDQGGQAFVSASAPGFQRGVTYLVPVTFTADFASLSLSSVIADPISGLAADGEDASTVTVAMRLADGTQMIDQVRFETISSDPGVSITAPLFDGVSATASFEVRSTEPGPVTVRVRIIGYPAGFGFLAEEAVVTFDSAGND